jgi:D-arginine dehydrogenase
VTAAYDIAVIGAGIAGASVAAHLAETRRVILLEMEERPGYHSTGRSAAAYEPNYGPAPIRALSRASRGFFFAPPLGFADGPLVVPRDTMFFVPPDQESKGEQLLRVGHGLVEIDETAAAARFPLLRKGYAPWALLDEGTADIDVDLLHQGFLRLLKARGNDLVCAAEVRAIERKDGVWSLTTARGAFAASVIVNAAGAWADVVAARAGVKPIGLEPRRRSVGVVASPAGIDIMNLPLVGDVGETWYAKPQSGKFLVSSADATPVEPHDAYGDDMAIAEGIERFTQAAEIEVTRIEHTWGGLRTFAPDGVPVCGYDPSVEGFFWLAGQGGYGIQSSPALSRLAATLVLGQKAPTDIIEEGLTLADLDPGRFRKSV